MENQTLISSIDVLSQALKELADLKDRKFSEKCLHFHADKGESNSGRGLLFSGQGPTKQFLFLAEPERFFSSETIDLAKNRSISIAGIKVLDSQELGSTVTKSNIREVGRLKGLIVDGDLNINDHIFFNSSTDRLGLGTDAPNSALSVCENGVELIIGSIVSGKGTIGTFAAQALDLVTDQTARISISENGNITLGNPNRSPIQTLIHGKLSIKVKSPDPEVDLHVAGSIKYNGKLQKYDSGYPTAGSYNQGDIVWNNDPKMNGYVGWVCIAAGTPGVWAPFGKIGNQ